jgi:hypothetical protein
MWYICTMKCEHCGKEFEPKIWRKNGKPTRYCGQRCSGGSRKGKTISQEERTAMFWGKVDVRDGLDNECWEWVGSRYGNRYGKFYCGLGKSIGAHQYMMFLQTGEFPKLDVLHSCDNPPCVNPAHLRLGTKKENTQDMIKKGRAGVVGSRNWSAKLKAEDVLEIRASSEDRRLLAARFGVCKEHIDSVKRGSRWAHIK